MTDAQLLEEHRGGNPEAFADLVRRHLGWVYGVVRRRIHDAHLAEDVSQAVFVLLHRKGPRFAADGAMINWLHQTARYATEAAVRSERRRQRRETEVAMRQPQSTSTTESNEWEELAPLLDELIGKLSATDREAVLLRYYRDMSFAQVGEQMGIAADTARKRVERAIEKLRRIAEQKGVGITAAALTMNLSSQVRLTPPSGLTATATGAATASANSALAANSASIVKGATIIMTTAQAKLIGIAAIVATLFVGGAVAMIALRDPNAPPTAPSNPAKPLAAKTYNITVNPPRGGLQRSPFSAVRWKGTTPEVRIGDEWYELVKLDDHAIDDLVKFAQKNYGDIWQKRLDEDLDDVLKRYGHPAGDTVNLQLRTLDRHSDTEMTQIPMTRENRQSVWRYRNQSASQPAR